MANAKIETALPAGVADALKKKRLRSPNYPAIGLEMALERAQTIQAQAGNHFIPVTVAHTLWDYKKGVGDQTVAALKAFGLVEVQGEKEKRQIRLTDGARRMLGNAPDRSQLLKAAALKPDLHKDLWEKYAGGLPADLIIRNYLLWERSPRFNEDSVDGFISQFRSTIAFANLSISDKLREEEDNAEAEVNAEVEKPDQIISRTADGVSTIILVEYKDFPLYLTDRKKGTLHVPSDLTPQDYELLQKQIQNHLAIVLATSVQSKTKDE